MRHYHRTALELRKTKSRQATLLTKALQLQTRSHSTAMEQTGLKGENDEGDIFEGLMEHIGMDGKFQARFNLIFNMGFALAGAMCVSNIFLALTKPNHWCHVPGRNETNYTVAEWRSLTIPRVEETFSKCRMYNLSVPLDIELLQKWHNTTFNETVSCQFGWEYDTDWYSLTAPSQEDWVCDKEVYVPNALFVSSIGDGVGTLVFGQLGDMIGRRAVLFIGVFIIVLGRCASAFTAGYYSLFVVANCLASLGISAVLGAPYIIAIEMSSTSRRTKIAMYQFTGFTFGCCTLSLIAWATGGEWKLFMVLTTLPCAAVFLAFRVFPESPRWLAAKGKPEKCLQILNSMAKMNGTALPDNALTQLKKLAGRREKTYGVASLFGNRRMITNMALVTLAVTIWQLTYYTIFLNLTGLSGNPFLNFVLQALVQLPAFPIGNAVCNRLGRRWCQIGSSFLTAFFLLACLVTVVHQSLQRLMVGLVLMVKFLLNVGIFSVCLHCSELYPTCLRQTGLSVTYVISHVAGSLAPFILYLGTVADPRYPYAILSSLCVVTIICASLLPETTNQNLPETLQDAAHFGKGQKFWSLPQKKNRDYQNVPT